MAGRTATIIIPIAWKAVANIDGDGNQGAIKNCPFYGFYPAKEGRSMLIMPSNG
jgi:hypothetical protein